MKKSILAALLLFTLPAFGQDIRAFTAEDIIKYPGSADTTYVINFWATWCAPCVQELPEFDDLHKRYAGKPMKMLMVSLDFKDAFPYKLQGFVSRKHMAPPVVWLSETDPNVFIPKIEEKWEGSIPATLIIRPGIARKFIEGQVTQGQVSRIVDDIMNDR